MPFLKGKSILISRVANLENSAKKHGLRHAIFNPRKDKYIGEWRKDIKEGKGALLTRSGRLYEGDWERGYRHGFGVLSIKGKEDILVLQYRGNWKNGKMCGKGDRHYPDGSWYKGTFKNSKRHGYGQMWYADGSFYDGDWKHDKKEGLGLFVSPNGNRYEGFWMNDQKHGKGRYYHLDSGQLQEGIWHQGVCVFSCIEDIPFLQTSVQLLPYCIMPIELRYLDQICIRREADALRGKIKSCHVDGGDGTSLRSVEFL